LASSESLTVNGLQFLSALEVIYCTCQGHQSMTYFGREQMLLLTIIFSEELYLVW